MKQRTAPGPGAAGGHACVTGSCLTHRQRVFWQSAESRWVHLDCFPCEPGPIAPPAPAGRPWLAMDPGDFDTAPPAPVQLGLFGEDEARGQQTFTDAT